MFVERSKIISEIFSAIYSKKFDNLSKKINELNRVYDINKFESNQITSLMTMFDFPVDKDIVICFHSDSVVLCYDSGYYYEGEKIQGERMFFYHDFIGMRYLKLLLLYIKTEAGKCSSCASEK